VALPSDEICFWQVRKTPLFRAFGRVAYGTRLEAERGAKVPPWVQIPQRPPILNEMLNWLKSLFGKEKESNEVVIHFRLPNGKEIDVTAIQPAERSSVCKLHPEYTGATEPTNGCNVCWEICSQKRIWKR
jgi:hypothetical protein